jgi:hypothetical protein
MDGPDLPCLLQHLVAYPISQDKLINIVCFVTHLDKEGAPYDGPTTSPCTQEEVLNTFKGWEEEVLALLRVRTVSEENYTLALTVRFLPGF